MNRGPVVKIWDKVQVLWRFIKDPDVAWGKKATAVGSLIYLISPLDAVPDFIPAGGLLDDVAVILFVAQMLAESLKAYGADDWAGDRGSRSQARVEINTDRSNGLTWRAPGPVLSARRGVQNPARPVIRRGTVGAVDCP